MFAVVEHDERALPTEVATQRFDQRLCGLLLEPDRRRDRARNERVVSDAREIDPPHAIWEFECRTRRGLQREPRLSTATGAGQRDQAITCGEQLRDGGALSLSADERRALDR